MAHCLSASMIVSEPPPYNILDNFLTSIKANPTKENSEFQDAILEDLALMGIKADKMSYTSDYFEQLYEYGVQIIKDGKAYADDTDKETMAAQRMDGVPSKRRDATVEENLARFEEMKKGTPEGLGWCIRAKVFKASIFHFRKTFLTSVFRSLPTTRTRLLEILLSTAPTPTLTTARAPSGRSIPRMTLHALLSTLLKVLLMLFEPMSTVTGTLSTNGCRTPSNSARCRSGTLLV